MKNETKNGVVSTETSEPLANGGVDFPMVAIPEGGLAVDLGKEVERIEKDIEAYKKVKTISLKMTNHLDWLIQGDGFYLTGSGADKIAPIWGVHRSVPDPQKEWLEDDNGRYFQFVAHGKAVSRTLGVYVEDIGTCSQRDKFFGQVGGNLKPLEDIDVNMIRKKAVSNCHVRLIKRICGLLNVTESELKDAGISVSKVAKVEYKTGAKKAEKALGKKAKEGRDRIWEICLALADGSEMDAKYVLGEISKFKDSAGKEKKVTDIKSLTSEKWTAVILAAAEKRYAEFMPDEAKK